MFSTLLRVAKINHWFQPLTKRHVTCSRYEIICISACQWVIIMIFFVDMGQTSSHFFLQKAHFETLWISKFLKYAFKREKNQGCLPFDRKLRKFWMEGKWYGHLFSEIPTEKLRSMFWGSRVHSGWYKPNGNVAYHLPISRFLLGSRLMPHQFAPFLDSNRNGCGNTAVN